MQHFCKCALQHRKECILPIKGNYQQYLRSTRDTCFIPLIFLNYWRRHTWRKAKHFQCTQRANSENIDRGLITHSSSLPTVARRDMSRTVTTRTTNPAKLHRQNIRRTDRLIRPILHLQNHCATLKSPQRMPLTSRDVQSSSQTAKSILITHKHH